MSASSYALAMQGSGSGVFTVDGTSGRLFQVDDSLSGSLFSVNTAAGLPVIEAFSDNTVRIGQFGQKALFVSQSKVGVGTETPVTNLDVSGSVRVTNGLSLTGSLVMTGSLTTTGTITAQTLVVQTITSSIEYSSGSNIFGSLLTNTQTFTGSVNITGSITQTGVNTTSSFTGNVGIGTTTPLGSLNIRGLNIAQESTLTNPAGITLGVQTNQPRISLDNGNGAANVAGNQWNIDNSASGDLRFFTAGSVKMYVSSSGNIGIGTTNPLRSLNVVATADSIPGFRISRYGDATQYLDVSAGGADVTFTSRTNTAESQYSFVSDNNGTKTTRLFIAQSGYVGINMGSPAAQLEVSASGTAIAAIQGRNPNSTTAPVVQASSITTGSTSWYAFVGQSGNGTAVTTNTFFVYGNGNVANVNNSYGAISDIKLKENIIDATPKLANIMQLKVRNFNFKADESKHKQIGFIAQELEQVFPGLIEETPDRDMDNNSLGTVTKTIKTSVLVPMLVKAIQELKLEIEELKNK